MCPTKPVPTAPPHDSPPATSNNAHDGRRFAQRRATTQADTRDLHGSWSCPVRRLDPHSQLTSPHHDPALWSGRRRWWAHHTDMGIVEGHFGGSYEVNGPIAVAQHTDSALTC